MDCVKAASLKYSKIAVGSVVKSPFTSSKLKSVFPSKSVSHFSMDASVASKTEFPPFIKVTDCGSEIHPVKLFLIAN